MSKETQQKDILKNGYVLKNYRIISVLGRGAFGITYKAYDEKESETVAIKEFFYSNFVVRENNSTVIPISSAKGKQKEYEEFLQKFQNEAETISKLNHINIVKVSDFFRANNTAYFVMNYDEGETLGHRFEKIEKFENEEDILEIIIPVLEGLKVVHQEGFLHRDLKPDNIYLRDGGLPMLLDFGAARFAIGKETKSLTAIATPGYAPPEQYSEHSKQSASTDLYAVGAILYKMITGVKPPDANHRQTERLNDNSDPIEKLSITYKSTYSKDFLKAIDASLELKPKERPQSIEEFQKTLLLNYYKGLVDEPLPEDDIFSLVKRYWYIWTIIGLLIFVVVFLSMKNNVKALKKQETIYVEKIKEPRYVPPVVYLYLLKINTIPSDANVKIMNIKDKYYDGIEVKNGRYDILVSKNGYDEKELTVHINNSSKSITVELNRKIQKKYIPPVVHSYLLKINTIPNGANVKILNIKEKYYNGMKVKNGRYDIQVFKNGYEEKKLTIYINNSNKSETVRLNKIIKPTSPPIVLKRKQDTGISKSEADRINRKCSRIKNKIARLNTELEDFKRQNRAINNSLSIEITQKKRAIANNAVGTYAYNQAFESYRTAVKKKNKHALENARYINRKVREFKQKNRQYRMTCSQ